MGAVAVLVVLGAAVMVLSVRHERRQIALVEDVLATVAAGEPIAAEDVCADPDATVQGLVENPGSWAIESYAVIGISPLTPFEPAALWYVDVVVDDSEWVVEVWDSGAGRLSGVCAFSRPNAR